MPSVPLSTSCGSFSCFEGCQHTGTSRAVRSDVPICCGHLVLKQRLIIRNLLCQFMANAFGHVNGLLLILDRGKWHLHDEDANDAARGVFQWKLRIEERSIL